MRRRIVSFAAAGLLTAGIAVAAVVAALPAAAAPTICEKFGTTTVSSGRYVVQNNNWGDDTTQCIDVNQTGPGFNVTTASHNKPTNGAPGSYPSVYFGCHYANCSVGSGLPMQSSAAAFTGIRSSVTMSYPAGGVWDAAYDIWFDPTPRTDGQNTGAEIMVWLNKQGSIQPVGSQVGTASINGATWNVWFGNVGWNVVSYVRQSATTSLNFAVNEFYGDAVNRGYGQRSWYLTSIQAGFEPWVGQTGLAVTAFSVTTGGGGGGDTTAPTAPANLTASGITASSANLSWSASTDNVGVAGYDILRAPGTSGGTFAQIGTATGTSFSSTGLTAATSYRYQVRARDAAGNISPVSNTVTVTTSSSGGGGGGGGACSATFQVANAWSGAFQGGVTVTNTSSATINGWTATLTTAVPITITQMWGGTFTQSGNTVTIKPLSYTATVASNATVSVGFIANVSGSTGTTATSACTSP
jgi:chitodextrinase